MDEILSRKTTQPSAQTFLTRHLTPIWNKLKAQLDADIKVWNLKCERFETPESRIIFYGNPAPLVVEKKNDHKKHAKPSPLTDLEFASVYAETFDRTFLGLPKKRVYLWMNQTEKPRILFNYGTACTYNTATQLEIRLEGDLLVLGEGLGETEFLAKTARELLQPLFEVR